MKKYISELEQYVADISKEILIAALDGGRGTIDSEVGEDIADCYEAIFNGISKTLYGISENNKD